MNKNDLISAVADTSGLSKSDASSAVEGVFDAITKSLSKGDEVRLVGFGTFSVARRKASTGRNPRTGEPMTIKASNQPKFKAGKGLKEKLLAALRGGIKTVLIPEENVKDLAEIPANVKEGLEIVPVSHVDEVLAQALVSDPIPIEWTEADDLASQPAHPGQVIGDQAPTAH